MQMIQLAVIPGDGIGPEVTAEAAAEPAAPKKRGRPPKAKPPEGAEPAEPAAPKKRGRPPKAKPPEGE